ncbi:histidine kinase [Actinoplanes sp. NPDC023714]|uniref:sensor histidine kinase n=1 Tax=Actinoplanes sp. NPDC023714 TaxID=3154322 RepID=UPI0033F56EA7
MTTRGRFIDAAAAVAVLMTCGFAVQEAGRSSWWQWVAVGAAAAPVAVRRRWPLPAALITLVASGLVLAAGVIPPHAAPGLVAAVALTQYPVAVMLPASRSVPEFAAALAGAALLGLRWPPAPLLAGSVIAAAWLAGRRARQRRRHAERVATERTTRAVTEERLRIARDVHDTVAHSLSMIAMKASVARHVAAVRPEESMAALEVIETSSREALLEMRRTVGLLRAGPDPAVPAASAVPAAAAADRAGPAGLAVAVSPSTSPGLPPAPDAPAPPDPTAPPDPPARLDPPAAADPAAPPDPPAAAGPAVPGDPAVAAGQDPAAAVGDRELRALIRRTAQAAGLRMHTDFAGDRSPPPDVGRVVYRVVQEALTNVVRHAHARDCTVTVHAGPDAVTVSVIDSGPGGAPSDELADSGGEAPSDGTAAPGVIARAGSGPPSGVTARTGVTADGMARAGGMADDDGMARAGGMADDGNGGHGLRGMRERVVARGGTLRTGPQPGGGFAVTARIPYRMPASGRDARGPAGRGDDPDAGA